MASCVGAGFDALQMHAEIPKGEVAHLDRESSLSCQPRLLERDLAPKRRFNGETHAPLNRSEYEGFEFAVDTCRVSFEIPTYEPPLSSAARSSALKLATPKLERG